MALKFLLWDRTSSSRVNGSQRREMTHSCKIVYVFLLTLSVSQFTPSHSCSSLFQVGVDLQTLDHVAGALALPSSIQHTVLAVEQKFHPLMLYLKIMENDWKRVLVFTNEKWVVSSPFKFYCLIENVLFCSCCHNFFSCFPVIWTLPRRLLALLFNHASYFGYVFDWLQRIFIATLYTYFPTGEVEVQCRATYWWFIRK